MPIYAAVEGGGTTWVCALADGSPENIIDRGEFPTTTPEETLGKVRAWLDARKFDSLGIATFGPVDPKIGSKTWGYITSTPKPNWDYTDVVGAVWDGKCPVKFDTDVNAPALAEYMYNSKEGDTSCAYMTVGTGVGVGLVVNGKTVHGLLHPEAGHVPIKRMAGDNFEGLCPFHGDCIEGLTGSKSISKRTGVDATKLKDLKDDDPVWDSVAHALASACVTLILVVSPERIVLSGGVMKRAILFDKVRDQTQKILKNYIQVPEITTDKIKNYITPSKWGNSAGCIGTMTLAKLALDEQNTKPSMFSSKLVLAGLNVAFLTGAILFLKNKK